MVRFIVQAQVIQVFSNNFTLLHLLCLWSKMTGVIYDDPTDNINLKCLSFLTGDNKCKMHCKCKKINEKKNILYIQSIQNLQNALRP